MSTSRRVTVIASLLLVALFTGSILTLGRVDRLRSGASLEEVLYISSPKLLKRLSLGYDGLLADIYWTRAVQYFGSRHVAHAKDYNLLAPLLEITTYLDPHLIVAYDFGAAFLTAPPPRGAGMPERAVELVENGIRNNPNEWRLYYDLGFIYYWELRDYAKAADAFARGSQRPNAHPFLRPLAARMAQHAGDLETARMMWTTTLETTNDKQIRQNAVDHLRALKVEEDVTALENLVSAYGQRTGRLPGSFSDLIATGMLRGFPLDPDGQKYILTREGRIEVRNPDSFPFITKGLPPGYQPPTPDSKKINPEPSQPSRRTTE